jgi:hypothetical protein
MGAPTRMFCGLPVNAVERFVQGQDGSSVEMRNLLAPLFADLPPYTHALYFGCVGQTGHHLWQSDGKGRPLRVGGGIDRQLLGPIPGWEDDAETKRIIPWGWKVDGGLLPKHFGEGEATLVHKAGWTALSFWDRTVDTRPGSCSTFLFNAEMEFHVALRAATKEFSTIFDRLPFEVTWRTR